MGEYAFELRLCATLETQTAGVVARQVGAGVANAARRVLDIVVIEPGPAFERRCQLSANAIPPAAIACDVGVGRWRQWPRDVDVSSAAAEHVLDRAVRAGFFEQERRGGKTYVRQTVRYPAWIGHVTAIENKPDLRSPGEMIDQLRYDVCLRLVDEVILATESYVTRAHLNRLPDAVGVWRVQSSDDAVSIEVIREPTPLDRCGWGIEIRSTTPTSTEIRSISPQAKRSARIRLAERAYGKGWRPTFPGCARVRPHTVAETPCLPHCDWKDRVVDPGGCGPACDGHDPADPPVIEDSKARDRRTGWRACPVGFATEQADLTMFDST